MPSQSEVRSYTNFTVNYSLNLLKLLFDLKQKNCTMFVKSQIIVVVICLFFLCAMGHPVANEDGEFGALFLRPIHLSKASSHVIHRIRTKRGNPDPMNIISIPSMYTKKCPPKYRRVGRTCRREL